MYLLHIWKRPRKTEQLVKMAEANNLNTKEDFGDEAVSQG